MNISACAISRTLEALKYPNKKLYFPTCGRIKYSRDEAGYESDFIIKAHQRAFGSNSCSNQMFDLLLITEFLFGLDFDYFSEANHSHEITRLYNYILEKQKAEDVPHSSQIAGVSTLRLLLKVLARTINYSSPKLAQIFFVSSTI